MKKRIITLAVLFVFAAGAFVSCTKTDQQISEDNLSGVSQKIATDFQKAKSNWNMYAKQLAILQSFKVSGAIHSEAERQDIISKISADDAMAAYGNLLDETTLHLNSIGELQAKNNETKKTMLAYLNKQVHVGDKVVDVLWQSKEKSFISKCIIHNNEIAWDNLLTTTFMMNKTPETVLTKGDNGSSANTKIYASWYKSSNYWQTNWIWNSKRGEMSESIKINCNANGYVYSTDRTDYAYMALGYAVSESKILNNTGSYGKIQYALGVATPFASLSINGNTFQATVTGLGSSYLQNGTHTLAPW